MSIRDQSWVPLSPLLPSALIPGNPKRKKCRLKENRSPGARLHLTQRLVSIVSPGNHLPEKKHYRRDKTPSERNRILGNQLFGGGINTGIIGGVLNRRCQIRNLSRVWLIGGTFWTTLGPHITCKQKDHDNSCQFDKCLHWSISFVGFGPNGDATVAFPTGREPMGFYFLNA